MAEYRATLDVLSDPICPWCYIGKAKLDRALAERPGHGLDIFWRIYQLNPEMPPEGMDRTEYLETKFGGPQNARVVYDRIRIAGEEAGLDLDFSKIARTPNTFDAHRLIRWARSGGHQQAVVDALFIRYFEKGEDIGDRGVLMDVATKEGMDTDLLTRLYADDADRDLLGNEEALARQMGVTGVPTFILAEKFALVGAQEPEAWFDLLDRLGDTDATEQSPD